MVRERARNVERPVVLSALGIDFSIGETPKNVFIVRTNPKIVGMMTTRNRERRTVRSREVGSRGRTTETIRVQLVEDAVEDFLRGEGSRPLD